MFTELPELRSIVEQHRQYAEEMQDELEQAADTARRDPAWTYPAAVIRWGARYYEGERRAVQLDPGHNDQDGGPTGGEGEEARAAVCNSSVIVPGKPQKIAAQVAHIDRQMSCALRRVHECKRTDCTRFLT